MDGNYFFERRFGIFLQLWMETTSLGEALSCFCNFGWILLL